MLNLAQKWYWFIHSLKQQSFLIRKILLEH